VALSILFYGKELGTRPGKEGGKGQVDAWIREIHNRLRAKAACDSSEWVSFKRGEPKLKRGNNWSKGGVLVGRESSSGCTVVATRVYRGGKSLGSPGRKGAWEEKGGRFSTPSRKSKEECSCP